MIDGPIQKIWLVVNVQRIHSHPPTFIHRCRDGAVNEAVRLAKENPGAVFHVVESVDAYCKIEVDRLQVTEDGYGCPF